MQKQPKKEGNLKIKTHLTSTNGRSGGVWTYSPFEGGDSPRNDDHPEDDDLLRYGNLQGMATVPGLIIVPDMGIVLGR